MIKDPIHRITHSIIAGQITLNHLESIKHTQFYKRELKQKLNLVIPELIKAERDYDEFFNNVEEQTLQTYQVYDDYIKAVASVPIWDCGNITMIIEAYRADQKSIEGICKKILKSKT